MITINSIKTHNALARSQGLELYDGSVDLETDAILKLLPLNHIMRQQNHHGIVVGIGLLPAAKATWPTDSTDATTADYCQHLITFKHHRNSHAKPMTCRKERHAEDFCSSALGLGQVVGRHQRQCL
jgi:hypothetical protein